jgi:flavin reductase (DIM6/NTAB) family NADH-FMN oxidoreductase RutF
MPFRAGLSDSAVLYRFQGCSAAGGALFDFHRGREILAVKTEIGDRKPDNFVDRWPGEFEVFSHFEMALGIPHALFLITTVKENGQPNACFQSWSSFYGDRGGYYVLTPLLRKTHTYHNILRTKEFCVNFISARYFDACYQTIWHNEAETDEIAAGGFTSEPAGRIAVPRIREAFLSLECVFKTDMDLSQQGIQSLVIGQVLLAAVEDDYLNGSEKKYGQDGFMYYGYDLKDFASGDQGERKVAALNVLW